jgi:hypothetical protein
MAARIHNRELFNQTATGSSANSHDGQGAAPTTSA